MFTNTTFTLLYCTAFQCACNQLFNCRDNNEIGFLNLSLIFKVLAGSILIV